VTHKFALRQEVDVLPHPGFTGTIVLIDLYGNDGKPRYLLDCHPGALSHYVWYIHPDGYGAEKVLAANWFNEDQLG